MPCTTSVLSRISIVNVHRICSCKTVLSQHVDNAVDFDVVVAWAMIGC